MQMLVYPKRVIYVVVLLMFLTTSVYAELKDIVSPNIVVNLPSRMLELYSGNTLIKEYPVAIGKAATPTPIGQFTVIDMEKNPTWIPVGRDIVVPSGPDNPLGYRWIGFFELYGVHGTNEPWTVGQVVSSGCVRMREESAEELFEVVKKGTPIKINYDRIKVKVSSGGQVSIGVYPDVYNRKIVTLWEVNEQLAEVGLKGLVSDKLLLKIIREEADGQVVLANIHNIKVNGKMLTERAVAISEKRYVPVWAIGKALNSNIVWDEKNQVIWKDKHSTPGVVKGDILYIYDENIKELFHGDVIFNESENCLEINNIMIIVNGKFLGREVEVVRGVLALPALPLMDGLGKVATYDDIGNTMTFEGRTIPITVIDDQPYIQINKINEYLKAEVFWDESKHLIEITYQGEPITGK